MAKDILVTESLSDAMMNAGAKLVEKLDAEAAEVKSAFWLYFSEDKAWKLILTSPLVDTQGPREFYKKIMQIYNNATDNDEIISLNNIAVSGTYNQLVHALGALVRTDNGIKSIRMSKNMINGFFIEDVYLYRNNINN